MRPYRAIADVLTEQPERFAVVSIDPSEREGGACVGRILSLHLTRDAAEKAMED
jgi:hypothetical protein